jgi:hypothetical protein
MSTMHGTGSGFRSAGLCCHSLWFLLLVRFIDLLAFRFARRHYFPLNKLDKVRASVSSAINVFEFRIEELRITKDSVKYKSRCLDWEMVTNLCFPRSVLTAASLKTLPI